MTQFGRPQSDVTVGSWSPFPASPTTLWDKTNEGTPNDDTDYIVSSTDEDECELGLTSVNDPGVGTGHIIRCTARVLNGGGSTERIIISLVENGSVRGSSGVMVVSRGAYALIEYTLLEAEANAITNYANLRIRIHVDRTDVDEPIRVTQAEFEVPSPVAQTLIPTGVESLENFGSLLLNAQQTLLPAGAVSSEGFGTAFMNVQQTLISSGIGSLEGFGTSFLNLQQTLIPGGIPSLEVFGGGALALRLLLSAIGSEEVFGAHEVVFSIQSLIPSGIASLEAFGNGRLNFYLFPSPVISQEGFGSSKLGFRIFPASVLSGEGFGTLFINLQQTLLPSGIASLEAFDIPTLSAIIIPEGVESAVSFGNTLFKLEILPSGIVSAEAFGILRPSFPAPRYHNVIPRERIFRAKRRRRKDGTANLL